MRRVLIVSPHFPPANGADAHRVRMVIPFLRDSGWDPIVLAVDPDTLAVPRDPWLAAGIPKDIEIRRVRALSLGWRRVPGLGSIDFRALPALRNAGLQLCRDKQVDLVYFSTTAFALHLLGPYWWRITGTPFVIDYQDPWVNDYYRKRPGATPPGGWLKHRVVDFLSRRFEPRVLRDTAGITSVSRAYPEQLRRRYEWITDLPIAVLPFPGAARDFLRVGEANDSRSPIPVADGLRHWVYVGRGGNDMTAAVSGLFRALGEWRTTNPRDFASTRLHFIGTSYAAVGEGSKSFEELAKQMGLGGIVSETPDRIPYSMTLRCLLDAHALIVPGSDDPGYTASKIYPYLLARKPLLAIFHRSSSVVDVINSVGGGIVVTFNEHTTTARLSESIRNAWFASRAYERVATLDESAFEPYTDAGSARRLCRFFCEVLDFHRAPAG